MKIDEVILNLNWKGKEPNSLEKVYKWEDLPYQLIKRIIELQWRREHGVGPRTHTQTQRWARTVHEETHWTEQWDARPQVEICTGRTGGQWNLTAAAHHTQVNYRWIVHPSARSQPNCSITIETTSMTFGRQGLLKQDARSTGPKGKNWWLDIRVKNFLILPWLA